MKTILIAEDHVDTKNLLHRLLRLAGYRAVCASDGEEALALLPTERPDLIILDMMMPGMDGLEVLRRVRGDPETAEIPVIAYSGISDSAFQEHAKSKGATAYCVKGSVDFGELTNLIGKYVRGGL